MNLRMTIMLVFGALLSAFVGFALAASLNPAIEGADGGDWLTAGAGAGGVMLTVLVAVGIEAWRGGSKHRQDLRLLEEALAQLSNAAFKIINDLPHWHVGIPVSATSMGLQSDLLRAIAKYRFVRPRIDVTDLTLWELLVELDDVIQIEEPRLTQNLQALRDAGESENVFNANRQAVDSSGGKIYGRVSPAYGYAIKHF